MSADFSRIRSNPLLDFAGVELKQGCLLIDAEFNEFVAVMDVVVEHGGEQVIRQPDRVEVTGEMDIDLLHRNHLGVAAARCPALHAEAGAQ